MTIQEALPLIVPVLLIELVLFGVVVADLVRREPERVRGPKWLWGLLSLNILGAVAYFIFGRRD